MHTAQPTHNNTQHSKKFRSMALNANDDDLIINAFEGNLNVVRDLLLAGANVNAQRDSDGATALLAASFNGHVEIVNHLLQHYNVDVNVERDDGNTALDVARIEGHANIVRLLEKYVLEEDENWTLLGNAMTTRMADPVELSYQYIKRCLTNRKLWSGASGDVFLAEDSRLPKKFAVKMIKFSERSDGPNDDNLKSFQKELSVRSAFFIEYCLE